MISMYGTYLVIDQSTVKGFYVSYPPRFLRHDLDGGGSKSYKTEIRKKEVRYESFEALYDERSYDIMENGGRDSETIGENEKHNYEPYYDNVMIEGNDFDDNERDVLKYKSVVPNEVSSEGIKTILWYDTHEQSMVGHSTKVNFSDCEYKMCRFKYIISSNDLKPSKPFDADAVLVQSKAVLTLSPPPRRDKNQVFVIAVRDSFPAARTAMSNGIAQRWSDRINWTMTYRLDSDIVYKYANVIERQNLDDMVINDKLAERKASINLTRRNYDHIFEEKTGEAVWFVSHCKTSSKREEYVSELQRVLNVKIYGFCGETAPCPKGAAGCFQELALKYKFYLAFENSLYADYVTEKVYHWFSKNIIVVARGGSNYSRILPPGTIIDAADFKSPIELGKYLKELANDKERYIAYLKRKDNYLLTSKLNPIQEANCKLCEYLHTVNLHRKSYSNIFDWWMQNWLN